jgi:hypothetical protein
MDAKQVEWIIGQGVGAVLALVIFLLYRKDVLQLIEDSRGQLKILTDLVADASKSMQANTSAVQAMERTLPHACPMADSMAEGAVEVVARKLERVR